MADLVNDWYRNLEFDLPISNLENSNKMDRTVSQNFQKNKKKNEKRAFLNKLFLKSNYISECSLNLHQRLYPILQWFSLMYYDCNKYIVYQPCEYCGERFRLYEKLVIPKFCHRNLNTETNTQENLSNLKNRINNGKQ